MIRLVRDFRLLPVVIFAATALFVLKLFGLLLNGGYIIAHPRAAQAQDDAPVTVSPPRRSWAQDMFGYPDITGSTEAPKKSDKAPPDKAAPDKNAAAPPGGDAAKPPKSESAKAPPDGVVIQADGRVMSPAERAILERLQARRQELEQRARELDLRENLINAADKRMEARIVELKDAEARVNAAMNKKDEVEAGRFKGIVTMYENMKPKDAAKIFDRLDLKVLLDVAGQIKPQKMSDILAQMSPEAAERLTVELARRANGTGKTPLAELPKIEGRQPTP